MAKDREIEAGPEFTEMWEDEGEPVSREIFDKRVKV